MNHVYAILAEVWRNIKCETIYGIVSTATPVLVPGQWIIPQCLFQTSDYSENIKVPDSILNSRLLVFLTTLTLSGSRGGYTLILNYQQKWNIGGRVGEVKPGKWWSSICCPGNCRTISDRCWRHPGLSWPDLGWPAGQKAFLLIPSGATMQQMSSSSKLVTHDADLL